MSLEFRLFLLLTICCFASVASKSGARIVGGSPTDIVNAPYIVSLVNYGSHSCGGSIINERTVITAAHCLVYTRPSLLRVHVGTKTTSLEEGQLIPVTDIHAHENWDMQTMDYDIGLVRLSRSFRFSVRVQPVYLPTANELLQDRTYGEVSGWGLTDPNGMISSNVLRSAFVPVVNQEVCNVLLNRQITDRMLCAGYLMGGIDACQMDSGGPLVANGKLVGIVSWGIGCAERLKPGVYTRVAALMPWVQETMLKKYNERLSS